jgi:hypothetical protein
MSVYSQLVNINRWLLMVGAVLVYVNTTLPISPQYGGGLCAALSTLALRQALHNKYQVMPAYAHLSGIDGKCANLKVTGGRVGKEEEINEEY